MAEMKRPGLAILLGGKPDVEEDEIDGDEAKVLAAKKVLAALNSKDPAMLARVLERFISLCDSSPEEEEE